MPLSYGTAPQVLDDRTDRRRQLCWSGILQSARGPVPCLVSGISRNGAQLSLGAAGTVAAGQAVTLLVSGMGLFRGTVVRAAGGAVDMRFSAAESASAA